MIGHAGPASNRAQDLETLTATLRATGQQSEGDGSMTCPNCGATAESSAHFCPSCGRALVPVAEATGPAPEISRTPPPAEPATPPPLPGPGGWPSYSSGPGMPPPGVSGIAQGYDTSGANPTSDFGAPLATWWQRVGSMLLDGVVLGIPYFIVSEIVNHGHTSSSTGTGSTVWVLFIIVSAVYFAVLNGTGAGQTLGNRVPGIAVRDAVTGEPIGRGRGLARWLVRTVLYTCFLLPGLFSDLMPLWDRRRQTLADRAVRSVVIRLR
jgi:uncharacterized RDD family membrane protein YckC